MHCGPFMAANDERDHDEGADADHERHVEGGGFGRPRPRSSFSGSVISFIAQEKNGKHSKKGLRGWG